MKFSELDSPDCSTCPAKKLSAYSATTDAARFSRHIRELKDAKERIRKWTSRVFPPAAAALAAVFGVGSWAIYIKYGWPGAATAVITGIIGFVALMYHNGWVSLMAEYDNAIKAVEAESAASKKAKADQLAKAQAVIDRANEKASEAFIRPGPNAVIQAADGTYMGWGDSRRKLPPDQPAEETEDRTGIRFDDGQESPAPSDDSEAEREHPRPPKKGESP
jgi:hypothetical protein